MMGRPDTRWEDLNPGSESDLQAAERVRRANLVEEEPDPTLAPRKCVWRCTMKRPSGADATARFVEATR